MSEYLGDFKARHVLAPYAPPPGRSVTPPRRAARRALRAGSIEPATQKTLSRSVTAGGKTPQFTETTAGEAAGASATAARRPLLWLSRTLSAGEPA